MNVTLEAVVAKQRELDDMIAKLITQPVKGTTIHIEEDSVELAPGEQYAGAVLDAEGKHLHHLVLMADRPTEDLSWTAALQWAEHVGGALPTRQEQALLVANCKPHLPGGWHWSCEEHESDASYAWGFDFFTGYQSSSRKSFAGRAVAVRRS